MRIIGKYWRVLLSVCLLTAAVLLYILLYLPEKRAFETEEALLAQNIALLQVTVASNQKYAEVQDRLPDAETEIAESREALYEKFRAPLKEEDQLLYLKELEDMVVGNETGVLGYTVDLHTLFQTRAELDNMNISFSFGATAPLAVLSDGAVLMGQTVTVYFSGSYADVKTMLQILSEEPRVTSVQTAGMMRWLEEENKVAGTLTLTCYGLLSDSVTYEAPDIPADSVGKDNIFE